MPPYGRRYNVRGWLGKVPSLGAPVQHGVEGARGGHSAGRVRRCQGIAADRFILVISKPEFLLEKKLCRIAVPKRLKVCANQSEKDEWAHLAPIYSCPSACGRRGGSVLGQTPCALITATAATRVVDEGLGPSGVGAGGATRLASCLRCRGCVLDSRSTLYQSLHNRGRSGELQKINVDNM